MKRLSRDTHKSWRERRRERLQRALERHRHPRFSLGVVVVLTGFAGFGVTAGLLALGVTSMALRYAVAVVAAYGVLVTLLWIWLRERNLDGDIPDLTPSGSTDAGTVADGYSGGGGHFGGGGASSDFAPADVVPDAPVDVGDAVANAASDSIAETVTHGVAEMAGGAVGEGCLPVVLLGLVMTGAVLFGWWLLSFAPALAAEFLVDAMLIALLYRRLRRHDGPYLLHAIVRRTRVAFGAVLLVVVLIGAGIQWKMPEVRTLGQALPHVFGR